MNRSGRYHYRYRSHHDNTIYVQFFPYMYKYTLNFFGIVRDPPPQGITKRCRLSLLTNSALVYESQCGGIGDVAGSQPMSAAVHITWQRAQINFGDLPTYIFVICPSPKPRTACYSWKAHLFCISWSPPWCGEPAGSPPLPLLDIVCTVKSTLCINGR